MRARSENELHFYDPKTKTRQRFPTLDVSHSKYLSVIIPAYKEVDRCKRVRCHAGASSTRPVLVPEMIKDTMSYLEERQVCLD